MTNADRKTALLSGSSAARIFASAIGPRIFLSPEGEGGSGDPAPTAETTTTPAPSGSGGDPAATTQTPAPVTTGTGDTANSGSKLTDKEADLLKDVMKTKGKLSEANEALKAASDRLKEFEGLDPAEVRQLVANKQEAERTAAEAAGDFARVKEMMATAHANELAAATTATTTLQTQLTAAQRQIDDLTVGTAFGSSSFISDELVLTPSKARQVYNSHFSIEDGEIVAYNKPAGAAERTKLVNSSGVALSFDDALRKLVEADPDRDSLLRSKLKPGASSDTAGQKTTPIGLKGVDRIRASLNAGAIKTT